MMVEKPYCGKKQEKFDRTRVAVLWLNREQNNKTFSGELLIYSVRITGYMLRINYYPAIME